MTDEVTRTDSGQWIVPPKSPGRPVGLSRAEKIAQHLEPHLAATLDKVAELARLGDGKSCELLLRYTAPPARPDAERISVPGLRDCKTLSEKADCILAACADGTISVEAAEKAMRLLDVLGRAVVIDQHNERIDALERGAPRALTIDGASGAVIEDNTDLA